MSSLLVIRVAVCVVSCAGLAAVLLTARGKFVDARNRSAVPLALWWLSPLVYYCWRTATPLGAAIIGVLYLAAGAWFLWQIYHDRGSTAAVGLLIAPVLIWPVMVIAVELDHARI